MCPGGGRNLCCRWCNRRTVTADDDCQKEELEQTFETAQAEEDERKNEHSEEWLNDFSQEAEKL
jgi:hypothetical protein